MAIGVKRQEPAATWWCPNCHAPRGGPSCEGCGLPMELAPRDPGLEPPPPQVEGVELRGMILEELDPVPWPPGALSLRWPWPLYLAVAGTVWGGWELGLARLIPPEVIRNLAVAAVLALIVTALLWRQAVVGLFRQLILPVAPRRRYMRFLRVEPEAGQTGAPQTSVSVAIFDPSPWPPLGARFGDANAALTFVGGWSHDPQTERAHPVASAVDLSELGLTADGQIDADFVADWIVPSAATGRPVVAGSGSGQVRPEVGTQRPENLDLPPEGRDDGGQPGDDGDGALANGLPAVRWRLLSPPGYGQPLLWIGAIVGLLALITAMRG